MHQWVLSSFPGRLCSLLWIFAGSRPNTRCIKILSPHKVKISSFLWRFYDIWFTKHSFSFIKKEFRFFMFNEKGFSPLYHCPTNDLKNNSKNMVRNMMIYYFIGLCFCKILLDRMIASRIHLISPVDGSFETSFVDSSIKPIHETKCYRLEKLENFWFQ